LRLLIDYAHRLTRLRAVLFGALVASCASIAPAPAAGAPVPAPAWSLAVTSYPTNFSPGSVGTAERGPGYFLVLSNLGAGATGGEFTVVNVLPSGLAFSRPTGATGTYGSSETQFTCAVAGQTVECHSGKTDLKPGESARLWIPVAVTTAAAGTVGDEASVSGGGAAAAVSASTQTTISSSPPAFGLVAGPAGLFGSITEADGSDATQAGSHPYQVTAGINFSTGSEGGAIVALSGGVKDLRIDLPVGLIVDPTATVARCTEAQLESGASRGTGCPDTSQVGALSTAFILAGAPATESLPLYNMVPPPGTAVELGFEASESVYIHLQGSLGSDKSYGLLTRITDVIAKAVVAGTALTLWGDPSDQSHDSVRGTCIFRGGTCPVERSGTAFLTLPGSCGSPLRSEISVDSWGVPLSQDRRSFDNPPAVGCSRLDFSPTISATPTTDVADSPTGLRLGFQVPQDTGYEGLAEAGLKRAQVELPPGLTVNPAGAVGLGACTPAQIGLSSPPARAPIRFTASPAACPDGSKLGTVEVSSPILDHPLAGAIYLAAPEANPYGSLLAIYAAIEDPASGIAIKLGGLLEPDPGTGQLRLRLEDVPQLPLEDLRAEFFAGARSVLKTPSLCGRFTTRGLLTPWSTPEGSSASPADAFVLGGAPAGVSPCPTTEASAPNRPVFAAGSVAPRAAASTPFLLRLAREDGSQRLASIEATLPPGLTGRLAGIPYCDGTDIAAASCPIASEVGSVDIAAGAGPLPLHLGGRAYLAGPYKGAPLSLEVLTPAIAGPFDLGIVTVRVALYVNPRSAQIDAVSDPLPTIRRGVPLDIRTVAVKLDRPGFTRNPSSCDPMPVAALATSSTGHGAPLSSPFQVGGCPRLGFKPKVGVRLLGSTHRGAHPGFRAVLTARKGDANLRRVAVTLPGTELLDNRHIGTVCTEARFVAERCPAGSVYGHAKAWTPLLGRPLAGPVYLRASEHRLPDLVASLGGQVQIDLVGRVDSVHGRLRNTFQALPDAQLSKVVLTMRGGRKGLLVNTGRVCARTLRADASFIAQNAKSHYLQVPVGTDCGK
jgi:hypothetical protein